MYQTVHRIKRYTLSLTLSLFLSSSFFSLSSTMTDATTWVQQDAEWQCRVYESTGSGAKRLDDPPLSLFSSAAEHALAVRIRVLLCDKPEHQDNRLQGPG